MVARLNNGRETLSTSTVGGKAFNLLKLKNENFNVPNFEIIPTREIESFLNDIGIEKKVLDDILKSDQETVFKTLEKLRHKILRSEIKIQLVDYLNNLRQKIKGNKIIIRSSATSEDGTKDSFAGIYDSHRSKNNMPSLIKSIKKVISSLFSKRAYLYLKMKKFKEFPLSSIIVQEFVEGDVSGVMFTSANKEGEKGTLLNVDKGTAISVVEGKSGEEVFLKKNNKRNTSKYLQDQQVELLVKKGENIENLFGYPQDVEWTIKGTDLFILQSRPITSEISKEIRVWDNSNIVESYSGIVLPLTSSYARHIYEVTYIDLARRSGLSEKKIKENNELFENLLGFFYGRFYYNMLSWYKMMTLFPGYERNKENLNRMISAKSKAELDEDYKKNVSKYFKTMYYLRLVVRYPFFEGEIERFKKHVRKYYQEFNKLDLASMTTKELLDLYYRSLKELLDKWSITVENDFLLMTFFGALQKFCKKNKVSEENVLSLVSDIKNVISAKQVSFLKELSEIFKQNNKLIALANKKDYEECLNEINTNDLYSNLKNGIDNYLNKYGGRFANELRLETEDFDSKPSYIIKLLQLYSKSKNSRNFKESNVLRIPSHLSVLKKRRLLYLLNKIKHYTRRREELRLLRSQSFSLSRRLFSLIGKKFQEQGVLKNERDIFYLEVNEIKQFIEGSSTMANLSKLSELRKKEYLKFDKIELEDVFVTEGDPYSSLSTKLIKSSSKNNHLSGSGCSHGIIKGKVKILDSFQLPEREDYEIIVTKHTDPGWTPLFGLCKGIIVENGGLLSHAAIISRELNLPCVIGAKGATKRLKDGQIITINGSTGEIKIHG